MESAALAPDTLFNSRTGVFIGLCNFEYAVYLSHQSALSPEDELHRLTGLSQSVAAGRLAYWFGFTGPAMVVDTACSSSLVTTHQACQSLRQRECDLALAGGVNLLLSDHWASFQGGTKSVCWPRMAAAKPSMRQPMALGVAKGCGMVVLKRLADAQADGNRILAVIRGSMVNQDGRSSGFRRPAAHHNSR